MLLRAFTESHCRGSAIKQANYEWNAAPAHILVTNQIGIDFGDMKEMTVDESN